MQASVVPSPAELAATALRGTNIAEAHVDAMDGRLIIRGLASSYKTKLLAGERAESAAPGMTIVNELRVAQSPSDHRHLARHVAAAIERAVPGAGKQVRVRARAGVVELEGTAHSTDERCLIESAAWQTNGVLRVESRVNVEATEGREVDVAAALRAYIERSVNLPSGAVGVRYRAGIATISGAVGSDSQAQAIEDLIRWHEGVADVVNRLRVAVPA